MALWSNGRYICDMSTVRKGQVHTCREVSENASTLQACGEQCAFFSVFLIKKMSVLLFLVSLVLVHTLFKHSIILR